MKESLRLLENLSGMHARSRRSASCCSAWLGHAARELLDIVVLAGEPIQQQVGVVRGHRWYADGHGHRRLPEPCEYVGRRIR